MFYELYKNRGGFADSEALAGQTVTVGGWVRTIRDLKGFGFIELNDGSCFKNLQVVMESAALENYREIAAQNVGAALVVTGAVVLTPEAKQPLEVKAASIEVEGPSTPDYPLQKKRHSVEYLRTIQHLRPRTNLFSAAFRVRSVAAHAIHCFFQDRGFVYVHTPIITASDCEGAGEMFQVTTLDLRNPPKKRTAPLTSPRISSASMPTSPCPASSTRRISPWLSEAYIPLGPHSGRRTPIPSATPPSSG